MTVPRERAGRFLTEWAKMVQPVVLLPKPHRDWERALSREAARRGEPITFKHEGDKVWLVR